MLAQQAGNRIPQAKVRLLGNCKLVRQHGDGKMQGRKSLQRDAPTTAQERDSLGNTSGELAGSRVGL